MRALSELTKCKDTWFHCRPFWETVNVSLHSSSLQKKRVLSLHSRRSSFIGGWAHSPVLGDSQDSFEPHSLAARVCRLSEIFSSLDTAAHWKESGAESRQIWMGWAATTVFTQSNKGKRSLHTNVRFLPSALLLSSGVPGSKLLSGSCAQEGTTLWKHLREK